jgi:type II secretory pathway component PulF
VGQADAAAPGLLTQLLESRGLVVIEVAAANGSQDAGAHRPPTRSSGRALLDATRAIAGLLGAGLPLARALMAAASANENSVSDRLRLVRDRVSRGERLATALAAHPEVFPPLYVGVVRAGERGGDLPGTFTRLAAQLEREDELRSKLLSAAIYPMLLAVVGVAAVFLLLLFVLPRFAGILQGAGAHLPNSTRLLLSASQTARHYWPTFLIPPAAAVVGAFWVKTSEQGAHAWASVLMAIPGIGTLRRDILAARFARMASVLLGGGAPVLSALDDTAASLWDSLAHAEVSRVRARIREGATMHRALEDSELFPPLLAQLVALGEETGRLEEFLRKAAELFEQRTERATSRLVALAEPVMIIVLGVVVGSVALSILQAIYGVNAESFR